MSMLPR
jgi:hypothetical protein